MKNGHKFVPALVSLDIDRIGLILYFRPHLPQLSSFPLVGTQILIRKPNPKSVTVVAAFCGDN
jgi:hypothetical protein